MAVDIPLVSASPVRARWREEVTPMSPRKELRIGRPSLVSLALFGALAVALSCGGEDPSSTSAGGAGGAGGARGAGGGFVCFPGETEPCYTGPVASLDVGTCRSGERTCAPDGSGYGVCEGEVRPVLDDCATPQDEDCDGTPAPACPGTSFLGSRFGGAGNDEGRSVVFDAAGNVLITGSFEGSIDFGGGELKSAGGKDVFVAKLGPAGEHIFSKAFGDAADQVGSSVAVGAGMLGSAVITGSFAGSINFGAGPLVSAGGKDVFVAKLSSDGDVVWARGFGDAGALQEGMAAAVDSAGNALVVGAFDGTLDLGGGKSLVSAEGRDAFALKLGALAGNTVWGTSFSGRGRRGHGVAAARLSLEPMSYFGSVKFGADPLVSAGQRDVFLAKLAP
jgi:hypothetical protein